MRLKAEEVERIIDTVLSGLKGKDLLTFKSPEASVRAKMISVFTANLLEEDKIEEEAKELLKKFERQIDSGQVDYRQMFIKVKNQLAKDRKFIL